MKHKYGETARRTTQSKRDPRLHQLIDLAREGNEDAIGDLWREFSFDFHKEGCGHE